MITFRQGEGLQFQLRQDTQRVTSGLVIWPSSNTKSIGSLSVGWRSLRRVHGLLGKQAEARAGMIVRFMVDVLIHVSLSV
jgi:hypothetical protein